MLSPANKENVEPQSSPAAHARKPGSASPRKNARKGRSKSIGPGGLDELDDLLDNGKAKRESAKNRRKSTYVPTTKAIISTETEKAQRQAARRKTLANRRVSFAPEATLHTWDVIEFMRDPTTSTDSPGSTRRGTSPIKSSPASDSNSPSALLIGNDDLIRESVSPADRIASNFKPSRRSSDISPVDLNTSDGSSPGGESGSSDDSGSEDQEEGDSDDDDDTGTAMSIDVDDNTGQSMAESSASTDSSARLEAALRQAADAAGTRGIEYDEYGDDESMEIAGDEITNAFKPWAENRENAQPMGSASEDQENVNPFTSSYKAQLASGVVTRVPPIEEEETGDLSMDVTRVVGGIVKDRQAQPASSPTSDGTMDLTQAVGRIHQLQQPLGNLNRSSSKRRRSTTETGSPGADLTPTSTKRRRSSLARSSMGDESMDLTQAVGRISDGASPSAGIHPRKSMPRRRSSNVASEQGDATMDITRAFGGVEPNVANDQTQSSVDGNEELTMELTTALGGPSPNAHASEEGRPETPKKPDSPAQIAANTTPKDQQRFRHTPDGGPVKLLTPALQEELSRSASQRNSSPNSPSRKSPIRSARSPELLGNLSEKATDALAGLGSTNKQTPSPSMVSFNHSRSPSRNRPHLSPSKIDVSTTPDSALKNQIDAQLFADQRSPIPKNQQHEPSAMPSTPNQKQQEPGQRLADSIKLMSTPRKELLKNVTPKKQVMPERSATPSKASSVTKMSGSRSRQTPKNHDHDAEMPGRTAGDELLTFQKGDRTVEKISLQEFLDLAGIQFMDLTTTKRRLTTAPTPSKARQAGQEEYNVPVELRSAVIAGSCTIPELDLYEHACHELKHYISDGKKVIKELEAQTATENPALIQAYVSADRQSRITLDAQMRDIKSHARLRSKEMWYAWRSQLLHDLTKALQSIGEGFTRDEDILQQSEGKSHQILPDMINSHGKLQMELEMLEQENAAMNEEEKKDLDPARESLQRVNVQVAERKEVLSKLRKEAEDLDSKLGDLEETRTEFMAAIKEADRVKEACRGISLTDINALKDSVRSLEHSTGWTITSASSSPRTLTMTYLSEIELFFHPTAFQTSPDSDSHPNESISLSYLPKKQPSTTARFFLQLLRASLHAITQCRTRIPELLDFVSKGWDISIAVMEAEQRLNFEALTDSRIISDERLRISSAILLSEMRSKVRISFDVTAGLGGDMQRGLKLATTVTPEVEVVYGDKLNEKAMRECLCKGGRDVFHGWDASLKELRERLLARTFSMKNAGNRRR